MKVLVSGLGGTVAPRLAEALREAGHAVLPWDRALLPPGDAAALEAFLQRERPAACAHLGTGSAVDAELAARVCAASGVGFLFTSSVSVFSAAQRGPHGVEAEPRPEDDYGRFKLECERRVRAVHPEARIVRLGWQIGDGPGGNQMVEHLGRRFADEGRIRASRRWWQACSFLPDTARSLVFALENLPGGLYHLDGNPGLDFFAIVRGLNRLLGEPWRVEPADEPDLDNRLLDPRLPVQSIEGRLGGPEFPS